MQECLFCFRKQQRKDFVSSMSKQAIFLKTTSVSYLSPCSSCKMRSNPQLRNLHQQVTFWWKDPRRESIAKWWNRKFAGKVCDNSLRSLYEAGLSNILFHGDVYFIIIHRSGGEWFFFFLFFFYLISAHRHGNAFVSRWVHPYLRCHFS